MVNQTLNSPMLGAWTFFASSHATDTCGINGLPLTPNSIRILGRFQFLKTLTHPGLCKYLDIIRSKHERLMVVSEFYKTNLEEAAKLGKYTSLQELSVVVFQVVDALSYLHDQGVVHRCLSPQSILLDYEGRVKISNYGVYYMTEYGSCVPFPIGVPRYLSPEVITANGLNRSNYSGLSSSHIPSGFKVDIWSLGIIVLETALGINLWSGHDLEYILRRILGFLKYDNSDQIITAIAKEHKAENQLQNLSTSLLNFIRDCLQIIPRCRPSSKALLLHTFFRENGLRLSDRVLQVHDEFLSTRLRSANLNLPVRVLPVVDHLAQRPLQEVYYLWQLGGGDVEVELKRQGLIKTKPPICTLPSVVVEEGEEYGQKKDSAYFLDETMIELSLDPLKQRLKDVDPGIYYPLLESSSPQGYSNTVSGTRFEETANLPLVIREKDIEYQLHRIVVMQRLLDAYPYKRPQIVREARVDIPPLYRARVWAALLEVEGDIQAQYDSINKETPMATDRQIEVDIPRCHQYDELLSSPTSHVKFKRLLKAWVVSHPQYVYWQGLDSLCAPFLYLNFNYEALAYACLSAFIPKYLHNFFLKDNSPVIQEYLAVFSHLIAFHDPELTNHLDSIGFIPELYAIPWFLTMYTHVFPLHKIFHLWDTLLLGNASFPLCIGVAILQQLRSNLLSFGFNECILLFSDMPEIDIQRCVQDSVKIFCSTPRTATFRVHEKPPPKPKHPFRLLMEDKPVLHSELEMTAIPLDILKSETCPRISPEEFLELMELMPQSEHRPRTRASKVKLLAVDIRPSEDFARGAIPDSINIPFHLPFSTEGMLSSVPDGNTLVAHKGKMVVVAGSSKDNNAPNFASQLVKLGFSRVCVLHGGIDVLRTTGVLLVRADV